MHTVTDHHNHWFYRALVAFVIAAPLSLVSAAGTLEEGSVRGDLIVYGHAIILGAVLTALLLRAMYAWGFSKASKSLALERDYSVAA